MKQKEIDLYMSIAKRVAEMSHAVRLKVGSVIAKPGGLFLAYGYNGMPAGDDNCCETEVYHERMWDKVGELVTKPEVLHAEPNAITKCAREGRSTQDAWIFQTHSPCIHCAKLILQAGITHVVYAEKYRNDDGIQFLKERNVNVQEYKL